MGEPVTGENLISPIPVFGRFLVGIDRRLGILDPSRKWRLEAKVKRETPLTEAQQS